MAAKGLVLGFGMTVVASAGALVVTERLEITQFGDMINNYLSGPEAKASYEKIMQITEPDGDGNHRCIIMARVTSQFPQEVELVIGPEHVAALVDSNISEFTIVDIEGDGVADVYSMSDIRLQGWNPKPATPDQVSAFAEIVGMGEEQGCNVEGLVADATSGPVGLN